MGIIICGFPGVGKTTAERVCLEAIDCESSAFHWNFDPTEVNEEYPAGVIKENTQWVSRYIEHILECANSGKYQYVLVSSHREVREALDMRSVPYVVVVPKIGLIDEYLARYVERGDCAEFIIKVYENWGKWINDIEENAPAVIHLSAGQTLASILPTVQPAVRVYG